MSRWLAAALVVPALAACSDGGSKRGASAPEQRVPAKLARLYGYDRTQRLDLRDHGVVNRGYPVKVHDVDFASPAGGRVPAYLMAPPGEGPFAGVVFMHGSGGTRLDFVATAAPLALRGAVTVTVTSPFDRPPYPDPPNTLAGIRENRALWAQNVVELRRAVDLLRSRPDVDANRIGFVGYSLGAEAGAVLAGVDHRLRAAVLISGGSVLHYQPPLSAELRRRAAEILATIEPKNLIRYADAPLFFQVGVRDEQIPRRELEALIRAAPKPKRVRWYDAGHALPLQVRGETAAWLTRELRIKLPGRG